VLHDRAGRLRGKVSQEREGRVHVGEVGLARVLAELEQLGCRHEALAALDEDRLAESEIAADRLVERRGLIGILSVTQALSLAVDLVEDFVVDEDAALAAREHEGYLHARGKGIVDYRLVGVGKLFGHDHSTPYAAATALASRPPSLAETIASKRSIKAEGFGGKAPARLEARPARLRLELGEEGAVLSGTRHGGDAQVILGGGADHRGAADVDALAQVLGGRARVGRGLREGVEVGDHHVEGDGARSARGRPRGKASPDSARRPR
jgi:hypothetical protein